MSILASAASVRAAEPPNNGFSSGLEAASGVRFGKAAFENPKPAVRVALCGVEADAGNAGLDAGLIDFNVPDIARAAGGLSDDPREVGKNVRDYRSMVFLGVTLGYHF